MNPDPIEVAWILINITAVVLTVYALRDARVTQEAVIALNGKARELVAQQNVRREWLRLIVQVCLLVIVIPGLFNDRPVPLSPIVIDLMAIPVILLLSTVLDLRDRRRLLRYIIATPTSH